MSKILPNPSTSQKSSSTTSYPTQVPLIINNVYDNFGAEQYLTSGYTPTDDVRPVISGRGPASEIITLYSGDQILGSVRADIAGRWELEITEDLKSGNNPIVARTTSQQSNVYNVIVELPADAPLIITSAADNHGQFKMVVNNGKTDDTRPTFNGRAGVGEIVSLYLGEQEIGSVQANNYGFWELELSDELLLGEYTVTAKTATQQSNEFTLTIESAADQPVTINNAYILTEDNYRQYLSSGRGTAEDPRPTFTGTAGVGEVVILSAAGVILGSVTTDTYGMWSIAISRDLVSGINNVLAHTATQQSNAFLVNVELPTERPVIIEYAYDDVGQHQVIYNNAWNKSDDSRPTFYGTAGANQLVTLFAGNVVLGSVKANGNGNWSLEINNELHSGLHHVVARTETRESGSFNINIETPADRPVTIQTAYDNVGTHQLLYNGGRTDDVRPTFNGTAGANQLVTLFVDNVALGSVRADSRGSWSLEIATELRNGYSTIIARTETRTSDSFGLIVENPVDRPVIIDSAYDNVGAHQMLYNGYKTDDMRPVFYGSAGSGQLVTLYVGEKVLGSVRAGSNGNWSLEIATDLAIGINYVIARTETQSSLSFTLNVESADKPVTIDLAYDNAHAHGEFLHNNSGVTTADTRPTFYGTAAGGQIVTLYSGETVLGSVRASMHGTWSLEITTDLPSGINAVSARTATMESGNFTIHVQTAFDLPVRIDFAYDNVSEAQYLFHRYNETTDDKRPTFYGFAGADQTVTLYAGETVLGSVKADKHGGWMLEIEVDLADGSNVVSAKTATQQSDAFVINVETQPAPFDIPAMADILIDTNFMLFSTAPVVVGEEPLVLTIDEADMQFQSQGFVNMNSFNPPAFSILHDEQSHLTSVM